MKIARIESFPLEARTKDAISGYLPYSDQYAGVVRAGYYATLVKITTDEGIVGWGESIAREVPQASATIINRLFGPLLLNQDPLDIDVLSERMLHTLRTRGHTQGFFIEAISGVNCALWDVVGKHFTLPVHKLLGGAYSDKIKAYASSILFGKPEDMVRQARDLAEKGHDQIKVKVGRGEKDVDAVRGIREALGYTSFDIMVDANSAFNAASAIRWGRKFEKYECTWFEEPLPPDDLSGYVQVARDLDIPICGSEGLFGRYSYRDFITSGAVDIIQPDIARVGGISEFRKIASMAEAFNLPITLHVGLSGAGCRAASLQVAPTIQPELFMGYELYFLPNPLHTEIIKTPLENFHDGYLTIPSGPGLCLQIDEAKVLNFSKS